MARPADLDVGRFHKIIALLDSPVPGERGAALEAARRTLDGVGLRFVDVVRPPASSWRQRAVRLLEAGACLTAWERSFLAGITAWSGDISPKQHRRLDEIEARHG